MRVSVPLVLALALAAAGQQQPVFRSAVDRVRVDVVVTGADDRPVTDLTRDEFSIVENGRPQTITDFRLIAIPPATRSIERVETRPAPADVATNAMASPSSRLWAIVVDDLHLIESDLVPIKQTLTDLVGAIATEDEVALVYVGRSDLSVNFTTDTGRLLDAIDDVRAALGFGLDAYPPGARVDSRYVAAQAARTSDTLRNVASALAGSRHPRRAIVYVGAMTTIDPDTRAGVSYMVEELQRTFEQAKRSNVPIYTIDPRGLVLPEDAIRGGIGLIASNSIRSAIAANIRNQQAWTHVIATNTGGRAFVRRSDLTGAVRELVEDNNSFYELAYSPDPLVADGRFHEFSVHVRRPGVRVRARPGYVAPGARTDAPSLQASAEAAMAAGVNVAALTLRAAAMPLARGEKGMTTAVAIEVEYPIPADAAGRIDDTLAVTVYALDPDARVQSRHTRQVRFAGQAPAGDVVTLLIDEAVELPARSLTLRVGVASQRLDRAGTVQWPLTVPDPSEGRVQVSALAIGLDGQRLPALNAQVLQGLVPFQPTTSRVFARTDRLRVFARAFWRSGDPPTVAVRIRGTGPARDAPLILESSARGRQQGTVDAIVPLEGMAPGDYVLEVTAVIANDRATREVPFVVR